MATRTSYAEAFPSGQRGQTVNLLRFASVVRIHPLPPSEYNFKSLNYKALEVISENISQDGASDTALR